MVPKDVNYAIITNNKSNSGGTIDDYVDHIMEDNRKWNTTFKTMS